MEIEEYIIIQTRPLPRTSPDDSALERQQWVRMTSEQRRTKIMKIFQEEVNHKIKEGYRPQGGIGSDGHTLYQSMIK